MAENEKLTPQQIVAAMIPAVEATGNFLDLLSKIGDWKFRTKYLEKVKMSNQDFEASLEENINNLCAASREYFLMHHFIQRENLWPLFEMFRAQCQSAVKEVVVQEECEPGEEGVVP